MKNQIEFRVSGRYALFTDPLTRIGGEKFSYQIPTYQALKGICESIYWKPTFRWVVDSVRIINPIRMQSQGIRPLVFHGKNTLSYYTYLVEPEYEVRAHFEWNDLREDLAYDRNDGKHYNIVQRMLDRGGRRDIFLGTRECQAYVEPIVYGQKPSYFDSSSEVHFDLMYHSLVYPSESGINELRALFFKPEMKYGEIAFDQDMMELPSRLVRNMDFEVIGTTGFAEFETEGWV